MEATMNDTPNTQDEARPLFGKDEETPGKPETEGDRARRKIDTDPALSPAAILGAGALSDTGRRKD
jgi:hypothetical protein